MKKNIILFLLLLNFCDSFGESGYIGEYVYFQAPSVYGIIDAAAWYSDRTDDLTIVESGNNANIRIDQYFSGTATITCQYAYHYYVGTTKKYGSGNYTYSLSCLKSRTTLNKSNVSLKPGEQCELYYSIASGYEQPYSFWETDNQSVADFEGYKQVNGEKRVIVTANNPGECTIKCSTRTGYDDPTCKITVIATPPQTFSLSSEYQKIKVNNSFKMVYYYTPSDAYPIINWTTSDSSIATVNADGEVLGKTAGKATITATTDNGLSSSCTIEVCPLPSQVYFDNNNISIPQGYAKIITPQLTPVNALTTLSWESENSRIASIDALGYVRGINIGSTNVKVKTDNNLSSEIKVSVVNPSSGMETQNIKLRISTLKKLFLDSINSK